MQIDVDTKHAASGHRIFLIDPDVVNRSALYFMMPDANEIHEFESVADIADMNSRLVPDIAIISASLVAKYGKPLIQGWRVVWPQVKVLVICESCDTDCITAAKTAGADDTLQRPFKREEIRRKVERWTQSAEQMKVPLRHPERRLHVRH